MTHDTRPAPILVSWDGTNGAPFRVARRYSLLMRKWAGLARPLVSFCPIVVRSLVAVIDRVANDYGVAVDGGSRLGDGEAVIFVGDEGSSLGLGDVVVSLVEVLVVRLIGATAGSEKDVSRAISVFQCRVSGVIQLLISFFFFNDTIS